MTRTLGAALVRYYESIPLTFSIANGQAFGFTEYALTALFIARFLYLVRSVVLRVDRCAA